jgi:electron transfer flavoprotein beta subunit
MGGGDREVVEMSMPCVVGATKGLNEPRYPKLPDILKAKKKPLVELNLDDLDIAAAPVSTAMKSLTQVKERGAATMMNGTIEEMVQDLVNRLENDAKVL